MQQTAALASGGGVLYCLVPALAVVQCQPGFYGRLAIGKGHAPGITTGAGADDDGTAAGFGAGLLTALRAGFLAFFLAAFLLAAFFLPAAFFFAGARLTGFFFLSAAFFPRLAGLPAFFFAAFFRFAISGLLWGLVSLSPRAFHGNGRGGRNAVRCASRAAVSAPLNIRGAARSRTPAA
ncbi:MAG: hypothetical protein ACREUW_03200 [Burkholderiales bacterium]